jgi:glycine hydroxymethyltransferase
VTFYLLFEKLKQVIIMYEIVKANDPELYDILMKENGRQHEKIELIASENFTSDAVMQAQGSVLTNKYAEGYPGKRYYGGCEWVDLAEDLARERLKQLFGAEYVNVQPHSGSNANLAVYFTFIKPGDTVMGLSLAHGGHLTHGSPVNFSGRLYNFIPYELDPATGRIDYDKAAELAKQHKPKLITVGASAYPRDIDFAKFRQIADSVGAFLFADIAHPAGLIAKGKLTNPLPYCDIVASTTHKTLRGPRGGIIMTHKDYENPFGLVAPKSGRVKRIGEVLDSMVMPGVQGGPLMHVIAAKAVAFGECLTDEFDRYTAQIIKNAQAFAGAMSDKGYNLVSGGTDNHLMLIDLRNKGVTGKQAENALDESGITCNKNAVPNDNQSPLVTSGIRLGTPAMTSRGFREEDFRYVAELIDRVITNIDNKALHAEITEEVSRYTAKFPLHQKM